MVVPYFDGERAPNRPDATGTITGLRSDVDARAARPRRVRGRRVRAARRARRARGGGRADDRAPRARRRRRAVARVPAASLADLAGRPVLVPDAREHVAAGACVQAAAVLHGRAPDEVAAAWGLGAGSVVEPTDVDRAAIRAVRPRQLTGSVQAMGEPDSQRVRPSVSVRRRWTSPIRSSTSSATRRSCGCRG